MSSSLAGLHHQHVHFEASATVITLVLLGKDPRGPGPRRVRQLRSRRWRACSRRSPASSGGGDTVELVDVPVATLIPGDVFVVRAGEAMPVDGEVIDGLSSANGGHADRRKPAGRKRGGDKVFAATINGEAPAALPRHRRGQHTLLASIIRLVEEAPGIEGAGTAPRGQGGGNLRPDRDRNCP